MIPPQYQYAIAAGAGLPSGSLVNVEAIRPAGDRYFYAPAGYYGINPGTSRLRLDGQLYQTGFKSTKWKFGTMTRLQYQYLISTYSVGGNSYSGPVTIKTMNTPNGTYTTYSGTIYIPTPNQLTPNFTVERDVEITFGRLE